MKKINRTTIGIDWELQVNSLKTGMSVGNQKIEAIISLSKERLPDMEIGEDMDLIEIRLGMTRSYSEFEEKTHRAFRVCNEVAALKNAVMVGIGYREADSNPAGGHIHAGSFESYRNALETHNRLIPFVPALIALASSCPSLDGRFKSIRMMHSAHNCSNPLSAICPDTGRHLWGTDVCLKYPEKPTLELRAADSQPSPELMCEIGALYLGLAVGLAERTKGVFEPDVFEYSSNRMNAVQNGMTASFVIEGREISASKFILEYAIPIAIEGLRGFGVPHGPFELASIMAEKRISASDWVSAIVPTGTDKFRATGELTRVFKAGVDPVKWIKSAQQQRTVEFVSPDGHVLDAVDVETPVAHVFAALPYPRAYIEKLLEDLAREKKVLLLRGEHNELMISRL
jgi:hypothetical protein